MGLSSLHLFNGMRLSLKQPSLHWTMAGGNSFENVKSLVVCKMISGRYRSDYMCRHWTPSNRAGFCLAESCDLVKGDLAHMLFSCPALNTVRDRLFDFWLVKTVNFPPLLSLVSRIPHSDITIQMQFVLDPLQVPGVPALCAALGHEALAHIYYLGRTFAYYMHRHKMISLGRWPGDPGRRSKPTVPERAQTRAPYLNLNSNCNVAGTADSLAITTTTLGRVNDSTSFVQNPCQQYQHIMNVTVLDNSMCYSSTSSMLAPGCYAYARAVPVPSVASQTGTMSSNTQPTLQPLTQTTQRQYQDCIGGFRGDCGSYDRIAQGSL